MSLIKKITLSLVLFSLLFVKFVFAQSEPNYNGKSPDKDFIKEDEDGNYVYKENKEDGVRDVGEDLPPSKPSEWAQKNGFIGANSDGSYNFETPESEKTNAMSLRFGLMDPFEISNSEQITYRDIYGNNGIPTVLISSEWKFFKDSPNLGFFIGSGLSTSKGPGRFKNTPDQKAKETYTLAVLHNELSIFYRFHFTHRQFIAPYVSAGLMPMVLSEWRDDNKKFAFVGAPAMQATAGVKLNISRLSKSSAFTLDSEYGINDLWLDIEYRKLIGLSNKYDMSSQLISAGFGFDF
jgi:hypothetical protein